MQIAPGFYIRTLRRGGFDASNGKRKLTAISEWDFTGMGSDLVDAEEKSGDAGECDLRPYAADRLQQVSLFLSSGYRGHQCSISSECCFSRSHTLQY